MALNSILQYFVDVMENIAFRRLVDLNWGTDVPVPQLTAEMVVLDPATISDILTQLVSGQLLLPTPAIREILRERLGFPSEESETLEITEEEEIEPEDVEPEGEVEDEPKASAPPSEDTLKLIGHEIIVPENHSELANVHNPRLHDEFWRTLTLKEEASDIRELKQQWDSFDDEMVARVSRALKDPTQAFLAAARRLLNQKNLASLSSLSLGGGVDGALERSLFAIFEEIGIDARMWAKRHVSDNLGLNAPMSDQLVVRWLSQNALETIRRLIASLTGTLTRKMFTDTELQQQIQHGVVTPGVTARLVKDAMSRYDKFIKVSVPGFTDPHVGKSIRAGRDSIMQNPRVLKAERTEILDGNTCENCSRLDGLVLAVDSEVFSSIRPPQNCQGGARCRGTLLFYLVDEENVPNDSRVPKVEETQI